MRELLPTAEEEHWLRIVIEDWETQPPFARAVSLAVLRGHDRCETVANYLDLSPEQVREAVRTTWGLLCDNSTGVLFLK